jgi:hypothetical protein
MAAWWLDDGELTIESRERAYRLYRERGDAAGAARMAIWLAWDYLAFRGEPVVARGWLQRAHRLLDGLDPVPEHPSLSTSGETLTIEESMNLEGENGERRTCWRRARMELGQRLRLLPPAAKTSET